MMKMMKMMMNEDINNQTVRISLDHQRLPVGVTSILGAVVLLFFSTSVQPQQGAGQAGEASGENTVGRRRRGREGEKGAGCGSGGLLAIVSGAAATHF